MQHNNIRLNARLVLSVSLGAGLFLNARLGHRAIADVFSNEAHRALRSQAMAELELTWRSPSCRAQWRASAEKTP